MSDEAPNRVCGVEREVVDAFLTLIRERYIEADKANHYLENHLGVSSISIGLTNLRDVLAHLATVLREPEMSLDKKKAQLARAEEHFHRAIFETYESAVAIIYVKSSKVLRIYKFVVLPIRPALLPGAPELSAIHEKIKAIAKLRDEGRASKARNQWDEESQDGVRCYVSAVNELNDLTADLEGRIFQGLAWWALVITVLGVIVAIFR